MTASLQLLQRRMQRCSTFNANCSNNSKFHFGGCSRKNCRCQTTRDQTRSSVDVWFYQHLHRDIRLLSGTNCRLHIHDVTIFTFKIRLKTVLYQQDLVRIKLRVVCKRCVACPLSWNYINQ